MKPLFSHDLTLFWLTDGGQWKGQPDERERGVRSLPVRGRKQAHLWGPFVPPPLCQSVAQLRRPSPPLTHACHPPLIGLRWEGGRWLVCKWRGRSYYIDSFLFFLLFISHVFVLFSLLTFVCFIFIPSFCILCFISLTVFFLSLFVLSCVLLSSLYISI